MNCDECERIKDKKLEILETKFWNIQLCPNQSDLGRIFVTLKEHKPNLSSLTKEEWNDFSNAVKFFEKAAKSLGAQLVNWTCLMNNAHQKQNSNPHVHWHARPRYRNPVSIQGEEFNDPQFGHHYDRARQQKVSEKVMKAIIEQIKTSI